MNVGFLPYIKIPILYILDAIQTDAINVPMIKIMESAICHIGTFVAAILTIIKIGAKNGIKDKIIDVVESGFDITT